MREYVKEFKSVSEDQLMGAVSSINGTVYAYYTDKLACGDSINDASNLLEVRVFDENSEAKFSRYSVNEDFSCRVIDDAYFKEQLKKNENDSFKSEYANRVLDDNQYLDIDSKRSIGRDYVSTGGGDYTLPFENAKKIVIRNYIDYDDNGIAYISDYRIVKILKEGEHYGNSVE